MAKKPLLSGFRGFEPPLLEFLEELADNNNRPWFLENKWRYEREVLAPSLDFIRAFQPRLKEISPYFVASDRTVGGSLMRVYRDTRFFKGSPYKTNVGIQFRARTGPRHPRPRLLRPRRAGRVFPGGRVMAAGRESLRQIRLAIVDRRAAGGGLATTSRSAAGSIWRAAA